MVPISFVFILDKCDDPPSPPQNPLAKHDNGQIFTHNSDQTGWQIPPPVMETFLLFLLLLLQPKKILY